MGSHVGKIFLGNLSNFNKYVSNGYLMSKNDMTVMKLKKKRFLQNFQLKYSHFWSNFIFMVFFSTKCKG
jgi:hypothetical protein